MRKNNESERIKRALLWCMRCEFIEVHFKLTAKAHLFIHPVVWRRLLPVAVFLDHGQLQKDIMYILKGFVAERV